MASRRILLSLFYRPEKGTDKLEEAVCIGLLQSLGNGREPIAALLLPDPKSLSFGTKTSSGQLPSPSHSHKTKKSTPGVE